MRDWVVVVTGAGSGIGLATTRLFVDEGATVFAGDLDPSESGAISERVHPIAVDLSSDEGCHDLIAQAAAAHGRVDVLVNNVGTFPFRDSFLDVGDDDWSDTLNLNFMSMVRCCRAVLPHMVAAGSGSIVSVGSECGRQPDVFFVDYSIAKAAMLSLSKALANEFGPLGVRSNIVSPGPTRTPPWDRPGGFGDSLAEKHGLEKEAAIEHFAKVVRKLPLGKLGSPADVASVVGFLASPLAKQVTGAEYTVNGGSIIAA